MISVPAALVNRGGENFEVGRIDACVRRILTMEVIALRTMNPVKAYTSAAAMAVALIALSLGAAAVWMSSRAKAFAAVEHGKKCITGRFACGISPEQCLKCFENGAEAGLLRATLIRRNGRTYLEFRVLTAGNRIIRGRKYVYKAAPPSDGKSGLVLKVSCSHMLSHQVLKEFFAKALKQTAQEGDI